MKSALTEIAAAHLHSEGADSSGSESSRRLALLVTGMSYVLAVVIAFLLSGPSRGAFMVLLGAPVAASAFFFGTRIALYSAGSMTLLSIVAHWLALDLGFSKALVSGSIGGGIVALLGLGVGSLPALTRRLSEESNARKKIEAELYQASKLASIGEMAGGIAHEINNPLAIIDGTIHRMEQLRERGELNEAEVLKSLERIRNSTGRIVRIVSGLKKMSRSDSASEVVEVTARSLIAETFDLCSERFRAKNIRIESEVEDLKVRCNPIQIEQVLLNLMSNAVHAIEMQDEPWVSVKVTRHGIDHVAFEVTDSGNGIPKEVRDRMLTAFYTTKPQGKGTGLGLSISESLVKGQGGELYYLERENTCFRFTVPIA